MIRVGSEGTTGRRIRYNAFTLVELLAVIFIIGLLISILVPSLSSARDQAKNLKIQATVKVIGDGLEMFKGENDKEFRASYGYPFSEYRDDPTVTGAPQTLTGAHWVVRHLLGKDLGGFVQAKAVPPSLKDQPEKWYEPAAYNGAPLDRVGPYVNPENIDIVKTGDLNGIPGNSELDAEVDVPVFVDAFGRPILYYVANPIPKNSFARETIDDPAATYTQEDNSAFTGSESKIGWDFQGGEHKIAAFGNDEATNIESEPESFCYYFLDKKAFETTLVDGAPDNSKTVVRAVNPQSYVLISPGKDGVYGSSDDIANFDR